MGFAALVGYRVSGGDVFSVQGMLLFVSAMLIGIGSNAVNDYFDRYIDSINKPWRPIPSGYISATTAHIFSIISMISGTIIGFTISMLNGLIAGLASILAYAYSWRLKRVLIIGNLMIALLSSLTIIYGGIATLSPQASIIPALYAFLINLGREFLKGIEDIEGDKIYGVNTLATRFGARIAYFSALAVLMVLILISPLPFLIHGYTILYLIIAILGVDIPTIIALYIVKNLEPKKAWKATRIMKISMFSGLLAFFVG
ncbi:MAG TPA: MFS transporter [Ignisphaera sp.]|nr:MFS transporter [Ignisphaera sp.]